MPNPVLVSAALYAVPTLPDELQVIGYVPGAPGYAQLKQQFGGTVNVATPHVRTVQKMFKGELIKYAMCDGIVRLLNAARAQQSMGLLNGAIIEAHEYYIDDLDGVLKKVAKNTGKARNQIAKEIAQQTGKHSELINALVKKFRTKEDNCNVIKDAILKLYSESCVVTNKFQIVTAAKKSSAVKSVPLKIR